MDTDQDGFSDGLEFESGTDPSNADDTPNLGQELVAYWPLDSDLIDYVGGNHGMPKGKTAIEFVDSPLGGAVQLNGIDQFIQIDPTSEDTFDFKDDDFSISCWFELHTLGSTTQLYENGGPHWWGARQSLQRLQFRPAVAKNGIRDGRRFYVGKALNNALKARTRHHFVAVYRHDKEQINLFFDGASAEDASQSDVLFGGDVTEKGGPRLGGAHGTFQFWKGVIDDVAIWRRALTPPEINRLWARGNGAAVSDLTPIPGLPMFHIRRTAYNEGTKIITFTWPSVPGRVYSVETSDDLRTWVEVNDAILAEEKQTSYFVPARGRRAVYVRVKRIK